MNPFQASQFGNGVGSFLGGMFGDSGQPYQDAMDQYQKFLNQGKDIQNPFYQAGVGAIPGFQDWLSGMKDPSGFINGMMDKYQQSPWAKFQTQQGTRAAQNAASASGLSGSTPLSQSIADYASKISSADMQNWLGNVLGVNNQYGQGLGFLMNGGQNAANSITNMLGDFGKAIGEQTYNKGAAENNDFWNMIGGAASIAGMFL